MREIPVRMAVLLTLLRAPLVQRSIHSGSLPPSSRGRHIELSSAVRRTEPNLIL